MRPSSSAPSQQPPHALHVSTSIPSYVTVDNVESQAGQRMTAALYRGMGRLAAPGLLRRHDDRRFRELAAKNSYGLAADSGAAAFHGDLHDAAAF